LTCARCGPTDTLKSLVYVLAFTSFLRGFVGLREGRVRVNKREREEGREGEREGERVRGGGGGGGAVREGRGGQGLGFRVYG
jgi:hypothetical protein